MATPAGLTQELGSGAALSVDFVEQFGRRVNALQTVLGITRKITVANGSTFKTYGKSTTTLAESPDKGVVIPLSEVVLGEPTLHAIEWQKHRKAVALEDIQAYGFVRAIAMTDEALLRKLQANIKSTFYADLDSKPFMVEANSLQSAMALSWGAIKVLFEDEDAPLVTLAHPSTVAKYIGTADVTMQTEFGLTYLKNFLGHSTVIVDNNITADSIVTTPASNLVIVNADVAGGDIATAGFNFVMDDSGLIGVSHYINHEALRAETVTASGVKMFAERSDGIVRVNIVNDGTGEF